MKSIRKNLILTGLLLALSTQKARADIWDPTNVIKINDDFRLPVLIAMGALNGLAGLIIQARGIDQIVPPADCSAKIKHSIPKGILIFALGTLTTFGGIALLLFSRSFVRCIQ